MKCVLDTNMVARLLEGDQRVVPRVNALEADSFGMPLLASEWRTGMWKIRR